VDIRHAVEVVGLAVDAVGVAVIVVAIGIAGVVFARGLERGLPFEAAYGGCASRSGAASCSAWSCWWRATSSARWPSPRRSTSVGVLAGIVAIRRFLSFSLEVELTERWPWQARATPPPAATIEDE